MVVGVPKETFPGERRVALVPATIPSLTRAGLDVVVQAGAGAEAGFPDEAYAERGAVVVNSREELFGRADVVVQVRLPGANPELGKADLDLLRKGQGLVGFCEPLSEIEMVRLVAQRGVTLFAMELVPRITRAQGMDALSSMATVAGYKAVLMAAAELPKMFPMLMTAAGTVSPAHLFVIGAGVAGLQAIATARRLGALVKAYDIRPAVKEQVQSLGADFVELQMESEEAEGKGGYAREMGEEFYRRQREMMARILTENDVVISTAAVPGKKAPILITREMVEGMTPGSVIVDLAAERGGNCELTRPGETIEVSGVKILGPLNLPATIPFHSSQMYSKNISTFLINVVKEGELQLDADDEITKETMVVRDGVVVNGKVRELLGLGEPRGTDGGED